MSYVAFRLYGMDGIDGKDSHVYNLQVYTSQDRTGQVGVKNTVNWHSKTVFIKWGFNHLEWRALADMSCPYLFEFQALT